MRERAPDPVRQLTVTLPFAQAQMVAAALEELPTGAPQSVTTVETTDDGPWRVEALFDQEPNIAAIAAHLALLLGDEAPPAGALTLDTVPDTDWVALALDGLPAIRAGRFFLHGAHHARLRPANAIALTIEAGMAFGTGHHGTTRGCLLALDRLAKRRRYLNVIDVGCGTGVLALAAAKLWRQPVLGTDIDPVAIEVADANARANGLHGFFTGVAATGTAHPAIAARAPYDLVFANILAKPLIALAPSLARITQPDGRIILSGLLSGQRRAVEAAYRAQGWVPEHRDVLDNWVTLTLKTGAARF
jgi:ribosomal protein L11 methyltransferase